MIECATRICLPKDLERWKVIRDIKEEALRLELFEQELRGWEVSSGLTKQNNYLTAEKGVE